MSDSIQLRKNLNEFYNNHNKIFEKHDIDISILSYFCQNLCCNEYDFYRELHGIKSEHPLSILQYFDIIKNYHQYPKFGMCEAAHITGNKLSKNHKLKYTPDTRNSYANGIFLCKNCHHAYDFNGGKYNPDPQSQDYHNQSMCDVLESKIKMSEFLI